MLAVLFRVEGVRDEAKKALFERFKSTEGLIAAYQLQSRDNPNDLASFTIWKDEAARAKFMAGGLKREIDQAWAGKTSRTVYSVVDSKS